MNNEDFSIENVKYKVREPIYINILGQWVELTWKCHICEKERPDPEISVFTRKLPPPLDFGKENIRYCNDNPDCTEKAKTHSIIKKKGA